MTKQESIEYIHLRAVECGFPGETLESVRETLERLDEKEYDHLKKISEPAFRDWCKNLKNEDIHE